MKMKLLLYLTTVMMTMMMMSVVGMMPPTTTKTPWPRTTVYQVQDLKGKMFTLSPQSRLSLYSPSFNPLPTPTRRYPTTTPYPTRTYPTRRYPTTTPYPTRTYPTRRYPTTTPYPTRKYPTRRYPTTTPYPTRTYPTRRYPTTTPYTPSSRGVSVCLRYFAEALDNQPIFIVRPYSSSFMTVSGSSLGGYNLFFNRMFSLDFTSYREFWNVRADFWTRVCVTVDTMKGVAQVFSDGNAFVRKQLPGEFVLTGDGPVLDIPGFDGQVTDVQVWDYPLRYTEVVDYMNGYSWGSVLSWSRISYSFRGNSLLEDIFEWQPQNNRPTRRLIREKTKKKWFSNKGERKERKREQL